MLDLVCYRCAQIAHQGMMHRIVPDRNELTSLAGILHIERGDDTSRPPGGPYFATWGEPCTVVPVTMVRGSLVCDRHIEKAVNDV